MKYFAGSLLTKIILWDLTQNEILPVRDNEFGPVKLTFTDDGAFLIQRSNKISHIWQTSTRKKLYTFNWKVCKIKQNKAGEIIAIQGADIESDGKLCIFEYSVLDQKKKNLWKNDTKALPVEIEFHPSSDRDKVILIYLDGSVVLLDSETEAVKTFRLEASLGVTCWTPDGKIAFGNEEGQFILWNETTGKLIGRFYLPYRINDIHYDNERKLFWIFTHDGIFIHSGITPEASEQTNDLYPLRLYTGYPIVSACIASDCRSLSIFLLSGMMMIIDLYQFSAMQNDLVRILSENRTIPEEFLQSIVPQIRKIKDCKLLLDLLRKADASFSKENETSEFQRLLDEK